jgi:hypothetical protein
MLNPKEPLFDETVRFGGELRIGQIWVSDLINSHFDFSSLFRKETRKCNDCFHY